MLASWLLPPSRPSRARRRGDRGPRHALRKLCLPIRVANRMVRPRRVSRRSYSAACAFASASASFLRAALGERARRARASGARRRRTLGALLAAAEILGHGGPATREGRPARERAGEQRNAAARRVGDEPRHEVARELHRRERRVERPDEALALVRRRRPEQAAQESGSARLDGEGCGRFVAELAELAIGVADRAGDEVERQRVARAPAASARAARRPTRVPRERRRARRARPGRRAYAAATGPLTAAAAATANGTRCSTGYAGGVSAVRCRALPRGRRTSVCCSCPTYGSPIRQRSRARSRSAARRTIVRLISSNALVGRRRERRRAGDGRATGRPRSRRPRRARTGAGACARSARSRRSPRARSGATQTMSQFDATLAGSAGIEPQRAAAHLRDRDAGRGGRQVDEAVHARRVPALAEERARADEHAASRRPSNARVARSTQRRGCQSAPGAVSRTSASVAWPPRASRVKLRHPAASRSAASSASASCWRAAKAATGDEQRAQRAVRPSAASARTASRCGAGVGSSTAASASSGRAEGQLRVAQHERAEPFAARVVLAPSTSISASDFAAECGQQPVDLRRAATDPLRVSVKPSVAQRRARSPRSARPPRGWSRAARQRSA